MFDRGDCRGRTSDTGLRCGLQFVPQSRELVERPGERCVELTTFVSFPLPLVPRVGVLTASVENRFDPLELVDRDAGGHHSAMVEVTERTLSQQGCDWEPTRGLVEGDDLVSVGSGRRQSDATDRVDDRRDVVGQTAGLQFLAEPADHGPVLQPPQQTLPVPTQLLRLGIAARQRALHAAAPQESQELVVAVLAEDDIVAVHGVVQRDARDDARVAQLAVQRLFRCVEAAEPPFVGGVLQIPSVRSVDEVASEAVVHPVCGNRRGGHGALPLDVRHFSRSGLCI